MITVYVPIYAHCALVVVGQIKWLYNTLVGSVTCYQGLTGVPDIGGVRLLGSLRLLGHIWYAMWHYNQTLHPSF